MKSSGFDLDRHLFYLLGKALLVRNRSFEPLIAKHGLTINFWRVLVSLYAQGMLSTVKLSDITLIDRTTLTRTLDKMCELNLVSRSEDINDRRIKLIKLTEAGERQLEAVMHIGLRHNEWARRGLTEAEYEVLIGTLKKVIANLENSDLDSSLWND